MAGSRISKTARAKKKKGQESGDHDTGKGFQQNQEDWEPDQSQHSKRFVPALVIEFL